MIIVFLRSPLLLLGNPLKSWEKPEFYMIFEWFSAGFSENSQSLDSSVRILLVFGLSRRVFSPKDTIFVFSEPVCLRNCISAECCDFLCSELLRNSSQLCIFASESWEFSSFASKNGTISLDLRKSTREFAKSRFLRMNFMRKSKDCTRSFIVNSSSSLNNL